MILRIALGLSLAALALIGVPSGAAAATTLGSDLTASPTSGIDACPSKCTVSFYDGQHLASSDGVVVRWRIKVGSVTSPAALRITRPGNSHFRTGAGTGRTVTPPAKQTSTYNVRLPIEAGDSLGLDCCPDFGIVPNFVSPTNATLYWPQALKDGGLAMGAGEFGPAELLINADIEPDTDHDGYGDETQDQCLGQPGGSNGCPTPPRGVAPSPPATTPGPLFVPPEAAPTDRRPGALKKCDELRKKGSRQNRGLAAATTEKKRSQIKANIEGTKRRLKKLRCP